MFRSAGLLSHAEKQAIRSDYFRYLIPTIIGQVAHCCYCMADVFFVGLAIGQNGLAALNVALPVFTIYSTFSILIGVGAATTISVCRGEGREESIDKVFTQALCSVLAAGAFSSVFGTLFLEKLARLFGATDLILPYVTDYLVSISMLSFVYMLSGMMSVIIRSDGNPRLVMIAGTTGNLCNILLDYIFVMKLGMGIFGAGLATILGPCVTLSLLSLHFVRRYHHVHLTRDFWSARLFTRMVKNGVGAGVLEISAGLVILMFNVVLIRVGGETAVAVFAVISNIAYVGKSVFNGMAQAAQPIISLHYGSGRFPGMVVANRCAMITAFCFAFAILGLVSLFPDGIIGFFITGDPAAAAMGSTAIVLYFLSFPLTGVNTILMYYFQSIEHVRQTIAIAVLRGVVLTAAALLILSWLYGTNGVWLSLLVSEALTFAIFFPLELKLDHAYCRKVQCAVKATEAGTL